MQQIGLDSRLEQVRWNSDSVKAELHGDSSASKQNATLAHMIRGQDREEWEAMGKKELGETTPTLNKSWHRPPIRTCGYGVSGANNKKYFSSF